MAMMEVGLEETLEADDIMSIGPWASWRLLRLFLAYAHIENYRFFGSSDLNYYVEMVVEDAVKEARKYGLLISISDYSGLMLRSNAKLSADDFLENVFHCLEEHCGLETAAKLTRPRAIDPGADEVRECYKKIREEINSIAGKIRDRTIARGPRILLARYRS